MTIDFFKLYCADKTIYVSCNLYVYFPSMFSVFSLSKIITFQKNNYPILRR
uniref:Uncharacterized protein n=1 Tax=Rhizophora mucronata TaxID=61149 RepID=A0A2P2NJE6_RHIMU